MNNRIHFPLLFLILASWETAQTAPVTVGQAQNQYLPHPAVTNLIEGIAWPKGQALPIFAKPATVLDTLEVQALSRDEQITFSALQGQVNRKQPRTGARSP